MSNSIMGPTWAGGAPVPLSPLSRQMIQSAGGLDRAMAQVQAPMMPMMPEPAGPVPFGKFRPKPLPPEAMSYMKGHRRVWDQKMPSAGPMPMMQPSGGGGQSFSFAPSAFNDGSRYNAEGRRPDGRKRIEGFSYKDAGLPAFGGLDEFYAKQDRSVPAFYPGSAEAEGTSAPEVVQRARDKGITSSFGGGIKGFANGGFPEVGKPAIVGERGPEMIVPLGPVQVVPNNELQPPAGWAAGAVTPNGLRTSPVPMPAPRQPLPLGDADWASRSVGVASPEMRPAAGWAASAVPAPVMQTGQLAAFQGAQPMALTDAPSVGAVSGPRFQDVAGELARMPNTDGRPDGVDPRAWKRFAKSPQGVGFMLNQQAEQQRMGQMAEMEDKRYTRARQDKLADMTAEQRAAQMEKDREASALTAGYDLMLKDYAGKGHLTPDQLAVFSAAKDPKQQAIMGKVLANLAESNAAAAAERAKQAALMAPPAVLGDIPGTGQTAVRVGGETKLVEKNIPRDLTLKLVQLPTGEYVYQHPTTGQPLMDLGVFDQVKVGPEGNYVSKPLLRRREQAQPERIVTDPTTLGAAAVDIDPATGKARGLRPLGTLGQQPAPSGKSATQQNEDDIKRLLGGK